MSIQRFTSFLVLIVLVCTTSFSIAQFNPIIRSGRPGQAIGAGTVGKGVFQVQSGLRYRYIKLNEVDGIRLKPPARSTTRLDLRRLQESTTLRYGVMELVELSAVINYEHDQFQVFDHVLVRQDAMVENGFRVIQFGGRVKLLSSDKWWPAVIIQSRVAKNVSVTSSDPFFITKLSASKSLGKHFSFTLNGISVAQQEAPNQWAYVANVGYDFSQQWGTFIEAFSNSSENYEPNWDAGLWYIPNANIKWDMSFGYRELGERPDWFVDFGISARFHNRG